MRNAIQSIYFPGGLANRFRTILLLVPPCILNLREASTSILFFLGREHAAPTSVRFPKERPKLSQFTTVFESENPISLPRRNGIRTNHRHRSLSKSRKHRVKFRSFLATSVRSTSLQRSRDRLGFLSAALLGRALVPRNVPL